MVQAYSNMALCCLKLKQYQEALVATDCALALDNNHVKSLYRRALALDGLGKITQAWQSASLASKLEPNNKAVQDLLNKLAHEREAEKDIYMPMFNSKDQQPGS